MVQVMEAWFLAERQALSDYYGQGFLGPTPINCSRFWRGRRAVRFCPLVPGA
jgi:hypothetical protein